MCISQLIESNFLTIAPDALLSDAIALMGQKSSNTLSDCVLIIAEEQLVGILTSENIIQSLAQGCDVTSTTVERVMQFPVITLESCYCDNILAIKSLIQQHGLRYLPILGKNKAILGIITAENLLNFVNERDERQKTEELERFFALNPSMLCIAGFAPQG